MRRAMKIFRKLKKEYPYFSDDILKWEAMRRAISVFDYIPKTKGAYLIKKED